MDEMDGDGRDGREAPKGKKTPLARRIGEVCRDALVTTTEGFLDTGRKKELWKGFSAAHGGDFKFKTTIDFAYTVFQLSVPFDDSEITFVESDTHPLKVSSILDPGDGFRFAIWPQDFVDAVMHIIGAQDVSIGDEEFDKAFVIKANDERRVKHLLESQEIRSFLLAGRYPFFGIESSEEGAQLRMTVNRTTETSGELDSLFSFFCTAIRRVRESGAAP